MDRKNEISYKVADKIVNKIFEGDINKYLVLIKSNSLKLKMEPKMKFDFYNILHHLCDEEDVIDGFISELKYENIKRPYKTLEIRFDDDKYEMIIETYMTGFKYIFEKIANSSNQSVLETLNILGDYTLRLPVYLKSDNKDTIISNIKNHIINSILFNEYISDENLSDDKIINDYEKIFKNTYDTDLDKLINPIAEYLMKFNKQLVDTYNDYNKLINYMDYLEHNMGKVFRRYLRELDKKYNTNTSMFLSYEELDEICANRNISLQSFVSKIDTQTNGLYFKP